MVWRGVMVYKKERHQETKRKKSIFANAENKKQLLLLGVGVSESHEFTHNKVRAQRL